MTNVNLQVSSQKYISLGVLLGLLVIIIPVFMFNIGADGSNPYVDELSPFIVLSMSCFVLFVLWVNRNRRIAVLEVFIFVYIIFWHFRFLTLALFPDGELVLTRTVLIDSEIFNDYIWLVFISLVATVIGICIGFGLSNIKSERYKEKKRRCSHKLTILVYRKKYNILLYCLFAFGYELYFMQILPGFLPSWKGYLGFLFSFEFFLFLVALTLLNELVSTKFKVIMFTLILLYVLMTVISGSRSVLMHFVIVVLFLLLVFDKPIKFRLRHFFLILLIGIFIVFSFAYGTYQRHTRSISGFSFNLESTQYILKNIGEMESWEGMLGVAAARAGFLDFSAELFANPKYGEVVTIENIIKATIDGSTPGAIFEDSKLLEHRIKDIYNPNKTGYQSDALGVVGENYLLFGYASPFVIAFVAFIITYIYYASNWSIFGVYIKFIMALVLMNWWNSFGYDLLFLNFTRQLVFGFILLTLIFYLRVGSNLKK